MVSCCFRKYSAGAWEMRHEKKHIIANLNRKVREQVVFSHNNIFELFCRIIYACEFLYTVICIYERENLPVRLFCCLSIAHIRHLSISSKCYKIKENVDPPNWTEYTMSNMRQYFNFKFYDEKKGEWLISCACTDTDSAETLLPLHSCARQICNKNQTYAYAHTTKLIWSKKKVRPGSEMTVDQDKKERREQK